jgi:hypothetical protein
MAWCLVKNRGKIASTFTVTWAAHVAEGDDKCMQHFNGKREEKTPLERLRRRREDNIKMDLKK